MSLRTPLLPLLAASAVLAAPADTAAQTCGVRAGVTAGGAYVVHRVADGTSGVAVGLDGALDTETLAFRVGYRRTLIEGESADPDNVRALATFPVVRVQDVAVCGDVHAGVTRFALNTDAGAVLAGGLGVTVAPARDGAVHPYASVRGLYGRTVGTVLGVDIEAGGFALGVEAGVSVALGALSLRLAAARDGFDDGLGVTPYPATSLELALGIGF